MFPVNTDLLDVVSSVWLRRSGVLLFDLDFCITEGHSPRALVPGVVAYTALLRMPHLRPVFITNRGREHRDLVNNQIEFLFGTEKYELLTRDVEYETLTEEQYKLQAVHQLGIAPGHIVMAFDMNPRVVDAYRKLGIFTLHPGT